MARKNLDVWIHEQLTDNEQGGKCTRIVLSHMVGTGRTEVHTLKLSNQASYIPKNLADLFINKADAYCQDMRGENRFMLDAYWGTDQAGASQPFMRRGQTENNSTGVMYPPTEEGRLMQKMDRETDFMAQVFKRQERQDSREDRNAERMNAEREHAHNHIVALMDQNMKMFGMMKDMMVAATLSQDERDMKKLEYIRQTQREAQIIKAIPIMANMATGREIFPQSVVDTEIIETLATKLPPDVIQMLAMMPGMSDEEKGVIMHRLNQAREKVTSQEAHRNQLPQTSLTGEEELSPKGDPH